MQQPDNTVMTNITLTQDTPLPDKIKTSLAHIDKILSFLHTYPALLNVCSDFNIEYYYTKPEIRLRDPALVGHVLGKDGWTRSVVAATINWNREISGIRLIISDAEDLNLDSTPVPPSIFPLMLADSAAGDDLFVDPTTVQF